MHKHRNLLAHAPERLNEEVAADYTDIIYAATPKEIDTRRKAPLVLGSTLAVAGLCQFTVLKHVCLRQCRSPWGFVTQYWREGRPGAVNMGVLHGLYCLGCCWARSLC